MTERTPVAVAGNRVAQIRSFSRLVGGVFVVLAAWWGWSGLSRATVALGVAGAALLVLGEVAPKVLDPVERAWMCLAHLLGGVMTRVLLTVVFVVVVIPQGLLMRLFGWRAFELGREAGAESYFGAAPKHLAEREHFERPF